MLTTRDNTQAPLARRRGGPEHHTVSGHPCECSMQILRIQRCTLHYAAPTVGIRFTAVTQLTFDP